MLDVIQRLSESRAPHGLHIYPDFGGAPTSLLYAELSQKIGACAAHFRHQGIRSGEQVLLPFETDATVLLSFFGLMEAQAIPLSVKPYMLGTPRPAYTQFLKTLCEKYQVERILDVPSLRSLELPLSRLRPPAADTSRAHTQERLRQPDSQEIAFVQFSSGSTSFPKGVPITYGNLAANLRMMTRNDQRTADDRAVTWLPLYHDMGLVGLLTCIWSGNEVNITEPVSFLTDPVGWLEFSTRHHATLSVVPNFAIEYLVRSLRELGPEELHSLDLSCLRVLYLGSEPINIRTLESLIELLRSRGLRRNAVKPCYGMAEAVLMVSCVGMEEDWRVVMGPNGQPAIGLGRPLQEFAMQLRTEQGHLCAEREIGEIRLRGGTVSSCYYRDTRRLLDEEGYYPTGDLGFLQDGELFICGRSGERIKINGQSYFLSDFEHAIGQLPFVRPGRAAVVQVDSRLVVMIEIAKNSTLEPQAATLEPRDLIRSLVRDKILDATGIAVALQDVLLLRRGQIPRTSSGKLKRHAATEALRRGTLLLAGAP